MRNLYFLHVLQLRATHFYIFFYILIREVKEFWKLFFKFKKKKNKQTYNILESKLLSIIEKNFTL